MSEPYEEFLDGEKFLRLPPRGRHEEICQRLHERFAACVVALSSCKLLPPRTAVQVAERTVLRPDLALVTADNERLWFVVEVINHEDHHADTVEKKTIYEQLKLPRLWMVDPRYDNVEIYHGSTYGLALKHIAANRDLLTESMLPGFQLAVTELFAGGPARGKYDL